MKELLIADFPITDFILQSWQTIDTEINKGNNGAIWYLNLAARVCLATLLVLFIIPAIFIDSVIKVINVFNIKREHIMPIKDFIEAIPLGIKKIATAIAVAFVTIFMLNIAVASVSTILFGLKAIVGVSALLYSIGVIKENEANIWSVIESIKEKTFGFMEACRDKVADFFNGFNFRSRQESGAPILSNTIAVEATSQYTYFPNMPTCASLYAKLPNNPVTWLFSKTTDVSADNPVTPTSNNKLHL